VEWVPALWRRNPAWPRRSLRDLVELVLRGLAVPRVRAFVFPPATPFDFSTPRAGAGHDFAPMRLRTMRGATD